MEFDFNEKVKLLSIEDSNGEQFDIEDTVNNILESKSVFAHGNFSPTKAIMKYPSRPIKEIDKIWMHERFVRTTGSEHVHIINWNWNWYLEEVHLPEGVELFSCLPFDSMRIDRLYIPSSLRQLYCFNDTEVIGLENMIENNNTEVIIMADRTN